jgi:glycosyltransferase involved in cell wall biosynthesis
MINHLFLYDFRRGYIKQRLRSFFSHVTSLLTGGKHQTLAQLPDYAFPGMISLFNKIIQNNEYDFIIIGYVYWANLLRQNLPPHVVKVLTIEDFISGKLVEKSPGSFNMELSIQDEIARVNLFDKVICLSHEELQFFSANALHPDYFYVPIFMARPQMIAQEKEYDILFIGYDNADNIEGLDWFFTKVMPLLPADLKIVVIGKIARYAPDLPAVTKMEYIPDPGELYSKSRISVNPLQQGTGMKVKVVESLAHGIPIVNTSKGLCGIPPEILGKFIVANDPQSFANEIHRLLSDPAWYADRCREAKQTFGNYFDAKVAKKELDKLFFQNNIFD